MKDGVPVLSVNHGSGTLTLQLRPPSSLADRRWHRLDIISDGKVGGAEAWTVVLCESLRSPSVSPQAVDFVLDQCGGATVDEREAAGSLKADESSCRAAGETPGGQR